MRISQENSKSPWLWIPSLYFAQGLPYVAVMTISVIMFKRLGISNADIAFYTSWLYLPWVIKPLWSPVVEIFSRKRTWIIVMQLLIGAAFASVALSLQTNAFFKICLIFFWLLAFNSATHDIAADGFYILALDSHKQALFVGVRSTFYRLSMIAGQGLLVMLAGYIENITGLEKVNVEIVANPARSDSSPTKFLPPVEEIRFSTERQKTEILIYPSAQIQIPISPISKEEFTNILAEVKKNNGNKESAQIIKQEEKSLWSNYIKNPLENFITKNFSTDRTKKSLNYTGNYAVAFISLNKAPESQKQIINVDFLSGDKSIKLIEGSRIEFSSENWNKPKALLFQLDPNLSKQSSAKFAIRSGNIRLAWTIVFFTLAVLFFIFFFYHLFILPLPESDLNRNFTNFKNIIIGFIKPFLSFFRKENIIPALAFLLLYRLGESQLVKLASPFLLDSFERGGMGFSTGALGFAYGTIGVFLLTVGGILGGIAAAKHGLKKWLLPMALAINLPNLVYVYMAYYQPENFLLATALIGVEQFGYGFGFAGYMLFMVYYAENSEFKTSHYAIMTGLMALGMMLPGMWSGWLQELIGYNKFFIWVCISTIPAFLTLPFLKINPDFGKK